MFGGFGDCCGHGWFENFGGFGWAGLLLNVLLLLGLFLLMIWIVRKIMTNIMSDSDSHPYRDRQSKPKEILAVRYARGEIDRDEFKNMLADLE